MNYLTHRLSLCPALSILSVLVFAVLPARGDFLWFKSQEKAKITAPSQLVTGQAPAVINKAVYEQIDSAEHLDRSLPLPATAFREGR